MYTDPNKNLYPFIDQLVGEAVADVREKGGKFCCQAGCSYCCHLLIEITWEEAIELALWIKAQPKKEAAEWTRRVKYNANIVKQLFLTHKKGKAFLSPVDEGGVEIPETLFDEYFDQLNLPCPFLKDDCCAVYAHRPSPCRLHLVSTPAIHCSNCSDYADKDISTPRKVKSVQVLVGKMMDIAHKDERWGHFGIMVEAALTSLK